MVSDNIYQHFNNQHFSPEKYQQVLKRIHDFCGDTCLRMSETPVFISPSYAAFLVRGATEIIEQSMALAKQGLLDNAVPPDLCIPNSPEHPTFFIIDFAATEQGPRLIEMQAFASNLVFIPAVAKIYKEIYGLDDRYSYLLSAKNEEEFIASLKKTILGPHAPENVALMEISPWEQQSRRDFIATQKMLNIPVVDVTDIIKKGNQLFYRDTQGKEQRIHRIYNRIIGAEYQSLKLAEKTQFQFTDPLDVEWLGDPAWFLKISKHTMPLLRHRMVPETQYLDQVKEYPEDLQNYVLKPIAMNAGLGVKLDITRDDLEAISPEERRHYILMHKVAFFPFIHDLQGNLLNAEFRVMFTWSDKLEPVAISARIMHGNDTNKNLWGDDTWCGMSPVLIVKEPF